VNDEFIIRPRKVCLCKNVSQEQIVDAIHHGAHTLEEIVKVTLASTGCGTCKPQIIKILDETLKSK